jgi:hypothetical protein
MYMNYKDLYALRYYIAFAMLVLGFYAYSGAIGWKWIGATNTEKAEKNSDGTYRYRYFHK